MAEADTEEYLRLKPLLFAIAYRMTGSVSDSEDIVSESFVRFYRALRVGTEVGSAKVYLSTITTRLSIDLLRSARHRRERYVGPWLPEPLVTETMPDVADQAELSDSLSMAFLILLERLNPVERAVFLLRDVLEFDYPQIADIVDKSPSNCRQLVVRARRHLSSEQPRFSANRAQRHELAGKFFAAVRNGDLAALTSYLAPDAVAVGDGGGNGPSLLKPINGLEAVARLLLALAKTAQRFGLEIHTAMVNGEPGALVRDTEGRLLNVLSVDVLDGRVHTVRSIINPDKLRHLAPLIDSSHPLRGGRGTS